MLLPFDCCFSFIFSAYVVLAGAVLPLFSHLGFLTFVVLPHQFTPLSPPLLDFFPGPFPTRKSFSAFFQPPVPRSFRCFFYSPGFLFPKVSAIQLSTTKPPPLVFLSNKMIETPVIFFFFARLFCLLFPFPLFFLNTC